MDWYRTRYRPPGWRHGAHRSTGYGAVCSQAGRSQHLALGPQLGRVHVNNLIVEATRDETGKLSSPLIRERPSNQPSPPNRLGPEAALPQRQTELSRRQTRRHAPARVAGSRSAGCHPARQWTCPFTPQFEHGFLTDEHISHLPVHTHIKHPNPSHSSNKVKCRHNRRNVRGAISISRAPMAGGDWTQPCLRRGYDGHGCAYRRDSGGVRSLDLVVDCLRGAVAHLQ